MRIRKILALALALAMCLGLLATPASAAGLPFGDVAPGDWFYSGVAYAYEHGLVNGTSANTFSPDQQITRAMFLTFLHRLEGEPSARGVTFLDVPGNSWYAKPVAWARSNQIVFGYGDGRFGPDEVLNREQMVLILYRYAEYKGFDLSGGETIGRFTDAGACSDYTVTALRWAVGNQIINGVGNGAVAPQGDVTRAQVAVLLSRFDQNAAPAEGQVVLSNFVAESTEFIVGDPCQAVFTVKVSGEVEDDVYLCTNGERLVKMYDNGTHGDETANDGIYSCIWNVSYPTPTNVSCYVNCGAAKSRNVTISFLDGGTITGIVCDAMDRSRPLTNASLNVYRDGWLYTTSTVDAEGRYSLRLPGGSYHVEVTCEGYVVFNAYANVTGGNNTYTETYMMISGIQWTPGYASGVITNAITGLPLENVALYVRNGWNNTNVGDLIDIGFTDSNGAWRFDLPVGNYTLYATMDGFIGTVINIFVTENGSTEQNGSISPVVTSGDYRVVLTWGENPRDLDSHLQQRYSNGGLGYHVYFSDKTPSSYCNLDVDDTTSYGPETVTLTSQDGDTYYYYVHRYSDSGDLGTSSALVRIYRGDMMLGNFNVPTDQANNRYWNVFAIKNGQLIVRNTITNSPETTYAD